LVDQTVIVFSQNEETDEYNEQNTELSIQPFLSCEHDKEHHEPEVSQLVQMIKSTVEEVNQYDELNVLEYEESEFPADRALRIKDELSEFLDDVFLLVDFKDYLQTADCEHKQSEHEVEDRLLQDWTLKLPVKPFFLVLLDEGRILDERDLITVDDEELDRCHRYHDHDGETEN
jgi:hypothetical protein